jgi:hypothetical protein
MNLLATHLPPTSCHFFPPTYKYLPQHHSVTNLSSNFFPHIETLHFMPTQNIGQLGNSLFLVLSVTCFHFFLCHNTTFWKLPVRSFRLQVGRQKILNWMAVNIPEYNLPLNCCACNFDLLVPFPNIQTFATFSNDLLGLFIM